MSFQRKILLDRLECVLFYKHWTSAIHEQFNVAWRMRLWWAVWSLNRLRNRFMLSSWLEFDLSMFQLYCPPKIKSVCTILNLQQYQGGKLLRKVFRSHKLWNYKIIRNHTVLSWMTLACHIKLKLLVAATRQDFNIFHTSLLTPELSRMKLFILGLIHRITMRLY